MESIINNDFESDYSIDLWKINNCDIEISITDIEIPAGKEYYILCMYVINKNLEYEIKFFKFKSNLNLFNLSKYIFEKFTYTSINNEVMDDRFDDSKHITYNKKNDYYEICIFKNHAYIIIASSVDYEKYNNTYDELENFLNRYETYDDISKFCSII
ncbi:hypothetical protein CHREV_147 [Choristoneura rosaceana entomopoxvirus 'L']|uniref:N1R/p28-like protein n=1 Tax=Choristoneura rosaceana entomopoxvirus 'L' TaxID=1293539 RepID=A0ABM9QKJ2_9POXV|nr:hypothetical protein CHREV_147 [Choristoneura rosaceana entomopoxvirus 'L']CCU56049.1 hypothetical protein CHREV_147 [Choristoneura rosaceana entomopoxvirus 'L']